MAHLRILGLLTLLLVLSDLERLTSVSDLSVLSGAGADDSGVDSAGDTVGQLVIGLGDDEAIVDLDGFDILFGRSVDHISNGKLLDALVLGDHAVAVGAVDRAGVSLVHLAAAVVSTLAGHFINSMDNFNQREESLVSS